MVKRGGTDSVLESAMEEAGEDEDPPNPEADRPSADVGTSDSSVKKSPSSGPRSSVSSVVKPVIFGRGSTVAASILGFSSENSLGRSEADATLSDFLLSVPCLHDKFADYELADSLALEDYEELLETAPPNSVPEEKVIAEAIESGGGRVDAIKGGEWSRLQGSARQKAE
jgi:hypothetical protein